MARISNWTRVTARSVTEIRDSGLLGGTVYKWRHDETGETVAVEYRNTDGRVFYPIKINGDADEARSTMTEAANDARDYLRTFPDGFDSDPV